jgi:hypothetical protein
VRNVGDLKSAEIYIDYFMQLTWDEPRLAQISQKDFLETWAAEQFGEPHAVEIAAVLAKYHQLNFV